MTPIIKNNAVSNEIPKNTENFRTVSIINENGDIIGSTYPKRAKGLIKNGRAVSVSDNIIRLNYCPTYDKINTEELSMDNNILNVSEQAIDCNIDVTTGEILNENISQNVNYLYFNPKEWMKHPDVNSTNFDRFYINNPFGAGMNEVISIGSWNSNWCEITNGMLRLERNTEYHFIFWLNGGENDRNNEICQFQVMFSNNSLKIELSDWNNKLTFKLNRSYIKPLKQINGWELYDLPFATEDKEYTQIRFVAQNAPMTIMHAECPIKYEHLDDVIDEFANKRPQRHNIIFNDGWPTNTWYSTDKFKKHDNQVITYENADIQDFSNNIIELINTDEIHQRIMDEIDVDDIVDEIVDGINVDGIREQIISQIKANWNK